MGNDIRLLVILAITLGLVLLYFVLFKYVFKYVVFGDSISILERVSFLKENNLIYQRHKILTQKELEKIPFKKDSLLVSWMVESTKYEFVKVIDEATYETKFYWLIGKASNYLFPFNKVNLSLKEEVDIDVIETFFDLTSNEALIVDESCPACNKTITQDDTQCPDCGLFFQ